jgi:hypothetical protein
MSSIYHGGTLKMYGHSAGLPKGPDARPEYYMHQLNTWGMTGNKDAFRQGATAFKNALDLTAEYRNAAIAHANGIANPTIEPEDDEDDEEDNETNDEDVDVVTSANPSMLIENDDDEEEDDEESETSVEDSYQHPPAKRSSSKSHRFHHSKSRKSSSHQSSTGTKSDQKKRRAWFDWRELWV